MCPWPRRLSSKIHTRTWAHSSSRRFPPRHPTSLVTELQPLRCSLKPSTKKVFVTSLLVPIQSAFSVVSSKLLKRSWLSSLKSQRKSPIQRKSLRSQLFQLTGIMKSVASSPMPWRRSGRTEQSPSKKQKVSKRHSMLLKGCSSIRATSLLTL